MNKLNICLSIIFIISSIFCFGQNSTNSPYTYYGIGEFETSDYSRVSGMSGVGIGIRDNGFINYSNPASYSSIDSLFFVLDIAASGTLSRLESTSTSYNMLTGNLKKIAIGLRLHPAWGISMGVVPFTNVGYKTVTTKDVEGSNIYDFTITSEGKGGLSKVYLGNAFKLGKHFSLGVNSNLIIGYYEKDETYSIDFLGTGTLGEKRKYKPNTAYSFDFGVQFTDSLSSSSKYTIGLIGGINSKLHFREYKSYEYSSSTIKEEYINGYDFWIPTFMGVGFSVDSRKWTFAADYKFQYWKDLIGKNDLPSLNNSHHIAVGAQYCPRAFLGKNLMERMTYQIGAHFDRSYLKIKGQDFDTYGMSAGVLIPIKNQISTIGISVDAGKKGRISDGMFKENYLQLNLSFNFADIWFQQRRFN